MNLSFIESERTLLRLSHFRLGLSKFILHRCHLLRMVDQIPGSARQNFGRVYHRVMGLLGLAIIQEGLEWEEVPSGTKAIRMQLPGRRYITLPKSLEPVFSRGGRRVGALTNFALSIMMSLSASTGTLLSKVRP